MQDIVDDFVEASKCLSDLRQGVSLLQIQTLLDVFEPLKKYLKSHAKDCIDASYILNMLVEVEIELLLFEEEVQSTKRTRKKLEHQHQIEKQCEEIQKKLFNFVRELT